MPVLTAIDVLGIQSYVFASNRLRDVVGASYLVEWASSRDRGLRLDNHHDVPPPEIIVAAGGNAILRFNTTDAAKQFALRYSRGLLERAPGLDVAIAHQPYDDGKLAHGLLALQVQLAKAKLNRYPQVPQLGLSVMQPCDVTGLPARQCDRSNEWVSSRIAQIRNPEVLQDAKNRWDEFLPTHFHGHTVRFPDELDQMGRSRGDTSLVGVVHVDGNGIGRRIQKWLATKLESASVTDEALINEYRKWSISLEKLGKAVFRTVTNRLISRIKAKDEGFCVHGQPSPPRKLDFELQTIDSSKTILLPLRPILLGGDDLTFVCDGRLALDLAATALRAFVKESASIPGLEVLGVDPVTACAGVALVRAHAPFRRSYQLSEDLCKCAKLAKDDTESVNPSLNTGCWIDWHIGAIRPDESVADIRARQYQGERLTCRPYPLDGDSSQRLTWEWLDGDLLGEPAKNGRNRLSFRNADVWGERRNKVKTLASLVGDDGDAVQKQLEAWKSVTADLGLPSPIDVNGFKGNRTPLLDAVELLDIHLRLETPESCPRLEPETDEVKA